jgi:two-component system sensor histidine kinase UhpB
VLTPLALLLALAAWWWVVRALHGFTVGAQRLSAALDQAGVDLHRLREDVMATREAERQELARELHDEFGQNLTVMQTAAAYLERHAATAPAQVLGECARDIREAATRMGRQVRGQLRRLHGPDAHQRELRAELEELVRGHWLHAAGLQVELQCPVALPTLSRHARLALYRTAQEALTNVVRHAGARRVRITVAPAGSGLTVCIEDDGHGTDVRAALRSSRSGLRGMRERAAAAHGRLRLRASELGGLRVSLWLPESGHVENHEEGDTHHGERTAAG